MVFVQHVIENKSCNLTAEEDISVAAYSTFKGESEKLKIPTDLIKKQKSLGIAIDQLGKISNTNHWHHGNESIVR